MRPADIALPGLDGTNPLAFLAALGVLDVLSRTALPECRPTLRWEDQGRWIPIVRCEDADVGHLIKRLAADVLTWRDEPILNLAYDTQGTWLRGDSTKAKRDLKPNPMAFKQFLAELTCPPVHERSVRLAGSFGSEMCVDGKGNVKPTAFHFTAGQQEFLKMAIELCEGIDESDFDEALTGPWLGQSRLPSFSWDSAAARLYALRAADPSAEKRGSTAAANWLGLLGLRFFPAGARGARLQTTCVRGGWKDSRFTWPLWTTNVEASAVASMLRLADIPRLDPAERDALGIGAICTASISRSDQGGYGSFMPSVMAI